MIFGRTTEAASCFSKQLIGLTIAVGLLAAAAVRPLDTEAREPDADR